MTTMFQMADYLLGESGRAFMLSTGEVCQTQPDPEDARHAWFVKNANSEEVAVFDGYIWRGTDTSPSEHEYYQLWENGRLGSRWCPAEWTIGEPFERVAEVRFFAKADGQPIPGKQYTERSWLEIVAHHPQKEFPDGLTISDVLELTWYLTPGASSFQDHKERYWYARGFGLVGFSSGEKFSSHITRTHHPTAPIRRVWPGIRPMTLPVDLTPKPNDPRWGDYILYPRLSVDARWRPDERATRVVKLFVGPKSVQHIPADKLTPEEQHFAKPGGNLWLVIRINGKTCWLRADMVSLEPDVKPAPKPQPAPDRAYAEQLIEVHRREADAYDQMAENFAAQALMYRALAQTKRNHISLITSILERTNAT